MGRMTMGEATAWALVLAMVGGTARAQTFEQVAPQQPPVEEDAAALPEPPAPQPAAPAADARVLLPALQGLRFIAEHGQLQSQGVRVDGIDVAAVPALDTPAFRAALAPYLGASLTMAGLHEITQRTIVAMRAADRPIVDVVIPEQNIAGGTVQLLVVSGRLGEVTVEGNRWFDATAIAGELRAAPGDEISGRQLLEDLDWLNRNPFRQVQVVFEPGAGTGEVDVILRTEDRRPWRVYMGYEDSGSRLTDEDRVMLGVNWGDAFGRGHQLSYQTLHDPRFRYMEAHSLSWQAPLRSRRQLNVYGSYARSTPENLGGLFNLEGESWQLSSRFRLRQRQWHGARHGLAFGVDYRRSNNDLAFGGQNVFAQSADIVQAVVEWSLSQRGEGVAHAASLSAIFSPGDIGGRNDDASFAASRSGARARYAYLRASAERQLRLRWNTSWRSSLQGQVASRNLLGSEQLGFGGSMALRGYDEREVNGDNGLLLINELYSPAWSPAARWGRKGLDSLQLLAFVDLGVAQVAEPLPGEQRKRELASTGIGLRYSLSTHLSLRADYGWQLTDSDQSDSGRDRRAHVGLTLSY